MLQHVPAPIGRALSDVRAGQAALAANQPAFADLSDTVHVASPEFDGGAPLNPVHTADGEGLSPALSWRAEAPAASVVLLAEDADSPSRRPIVHAIAWNLPPSGSLAAGEMREGGPVSLGLNSYRRRGWLPPDSPTGHGPHAYVFQLFALDRRLDFAEPPGGDELLAAMHGHVLATSWLTGTYERPAGRASGLPLVAAAGAVALALVAIGRKRCRTAGDHA